MGKVCSGGSLKKKAALAAAAGAAIYSFLPSAAGKLYYRCSPKGSDRVLYLTFDDGPSEAYTGELLDILKQYGVTASFFVVAEQAAAHPQLIRRMQLEGHLIGLHSLNHVSAMLQTPAGTIDDFRQSVEIMKELGVEPVYYRPPWGHVNLSTFSCLRRYGLKKVLWHVMAQDWEAGISEEQIQYRLLRRAGNGSVICLHDGRGRNGAPERMLEALKKTIPLWLEEGYRFRRIDERRDVR